MVAAGNQGEEERLKEEGRKKRQAVNLPEYKRQLSEIDRQFGALLKQLPNRSEMKSLLADINQAGLRTRAAVRAFKPGTEVMKDFYAELPIAVRVIGNYHDLGEFVERRGADAADRHPQRHRHRDAEGWRAQVRCDGRTYRYLDDDEVAKSAQGKGQGKGG